MSGWTGAERRRVGFSVAAVALLALAGTALAGSFDPRPGDIPVGTAGGIKYVKDSAAFDPSNSNFASDAIWCGSGRRVTGGGAKLGGDAAAKFLEASLPRDVYLGYGDADDVHDDSWDASGYGPDGESVTAFGICLRPADFDAGLKYVYRDVPDSSNGNRSAKVACGGGYHAVGGGGLIAPSESWINSSYPVDGGDPGRTPDDGWKVRVFDPVGGIGGFVIEVVCMRGANLRYVRENANGAAAGEWASPRAKCGQRHVVGGGVKVAGPPDLGRVASTYPFDGADAKQVPDDGWRATGYNVSGLPKRVTTYAICLA
jgi:hypothetical protein